MNILTRHEIRGHLAENELKRKLRARVITAVRSNLMFEVSVSKEIFELLFLGFTNTKTR